MNITKEQADKVIVPLAFVQAFNTLAHNYSLTAIPPDYYSGTEGDAFTSAYRRCGHDLAEIRAMLGENPTIMRGLAEDAEPVASDSLGQPDNLEVIIDAFVEDYEMLGETEDGRDACHIPTDGERALIKDAICGLLADTDWDNAWGAHVKSIATSPQAAQTDEREAFEAFTKLEHNCVPKWDDAQGAYAVFEYDMMFDAFKAGRAGRKG